jgi:hypothetical protein
MTGLAVSPSTAARRRVTSAANLICPRWSLSKHDPSERPPPRRRGTDAKAGANVWPLTTSDGRLAGLMLRQDAIRAAARVAQAASENPAVGLRGSPRCVRCSRRSRSCRSAARASSAGAGSRSSRCFAEPQERSLLVGENGNACARACAGQTRSCRSTASAAAMRALLPERVRPADAHDVLTPQAHPTRRAHSR